MTFANDDSLGAAQCMVVLCWKAEAILPSAWRWQSPGFILLKVVWNNGTEMDWPHVAQRPEHRGLLPRTWWSADAARGPVLNQGEES